MAPAPLAHPELIRLPRCTRRRVSEDHLVAATLAPNLYAHVGHGTIL
jgi:hypothetical protein